MDENSVQSKSNLDAWEKRARLLRTVAHPVRLLILESLCDGPRCVADINALIDIAQPHLSQHIAALREARLIACHVNGPLRCYYILTPTLVKRLIRLICGEHPERLRKQTAVIRETRRKRESRTPRSTQAKPPEK